MEDDVIRVLKNGIRKTLIDCISDAKQGELSPHWQEYLRREIEAGREGGYLPRETDIMLEHLDTILAEVPQLSDIDLNRRQLALSGTELLYHYPTEDYGTLLEIIYMPDTNWYSGCVYLDEDAAASDPRAYTKPMEDAVWAWMRSQKIELEESEIPTEAPDTDSNEFDNIKSILIYIISALRYPEKLVYV